MSAVARTEPAARPATINRGFALLAVTAVEDAGIVGAERRSIPTRGGCRRPRPMTGLIGTASGFEAAFTLGRPDARFGPTDVFAAAVPSPMTPDVKGNDS